jgi:hypothetical protein
MKQYNSFYKSKNIDLELRFVMITVTLLSAQGHSDEFLKLRLLKPFIKKLERDYKIENWIWKAEKQDNGNIHFHIVIDKYIPVKDLRSIAIFYQKKLGYYDRFRAKFPTGVAPCVHVIGNVGKKSPVNYLLKYLEKNEDKPKVSGALWRCSQKLVNLVPFKFEISESEAITVRDILKESNVYCYQDEYFTYFKFEKPINFQIISEAAFLKSELYYNSMMRYLYFNDHKYIEKYSPDYFFSNNNYPEQNELSINPSLMEEGIFPENYQLRLF